MRLWNTGAVVAVLLIVVPAWASIVYAANRNVNLAPGEMATVNCPSVLSAVIGQNQASLVCAALTLTPTRTPTGVPVTATATNVPPTSTPGSGGAVTTWHPPTDHEHGDQPPTWAEIWSQQQLGHGIVFGGDEASSPAENAIKHNVFKGMLGASEAGGALYWRYHAGSNPLDRSAQYHSYEVYYKDTSGGISFWQGHYDAGDPAPGPARFPRRLGETGTRPVILVVDAQTYPNNPSNCEQWYMFSQGWSWDFGLTICGSTTLYSTSENATASDQSTWILSPDGNAGVHRRGDGSFYPSRVPITGWFCSGPKTSAIVSTGDKTCPVGTGALPQFLAPSLAADARNDGFGNERIRFVIEKDFPCTACVVPN